MYYFGAANAVRKGWRAQLEIHRTPTSRKCSRPVALAIIDMNANVVSDIWLANWHIVSQNTKSHIDYLLCCTVNLIVTHL
jgi:hypothetical protein